MLLGNRIDPFTSIGFDGEGHSVTLRWSSGPFGNERAGRHEEPADMNDLLPAAPQGYALVAQIGRGASSVVWEAQDATGRRVALKILEADVSDPDAVRRFECERDAMTALARHPHILTIVDAGVHGIRPWLAVELCRRGSLAAYVADGGALDLPTALRVIHRLAEALGVAHDAGVVHCDVKPANVMLTDDGEPALGDFGIARVSVGRATTTTVGGFSLDHVAPELLDDGKRSPRSDVYSLGTTAWELLVGHPPFQRTDDVSVGTVLTRVLRQPLPESPSIPDDLLALLRRMAAKTPEERPASMDEVGEQLRRIAERHGIDLDEQPLPAATAVERELSRMPLAAVPPELGAAATRLRPSVDGRQSTAAVGKARDRRPPLIAAVVVALLILGGVGVGAYQMVGEPTAVPTAAAAVEQAAPPVPEAPAVPAPTDVPAEPVAPVAATVPSSRGAGAPRPTVPAQQPVQQPVRQPVRQPDPPQSSDPPVASPPIVSKPPDDDPTPVKKPPRYDPNGDGKLSCADQETLLAQWGKDGSGDLNGNGTVDITDMSMLLSEMSKAGVTSC